MLRKQKQQIIPVFTILKVKAPLAFNFFFYSFKLFNFFFFLTSGHYRTEATDNDEQVSSQDYASIL